MWGRGRGRGRKRWRRRRGRRRRRKRKRRRPAREEAEKRTDEKRDIGDSKCALVKVVGYYLNHKQLCGKKYQLYY